MSGRDQARAVVLAALLVLSTFSIVGAGAASASTGNTAETTFHVSQNGQCYSVSALGDGSQTVEEYYDYRNPSNSDEYNYTYSSHGTTDLQENQVSNVFVYHGSEGFSLVMVHDELDVDGQDAPYGSTITFEFSNMGDGEWAVRDDNYTDDSGNQQDDNWDTSGSNHVVDWMWAEHRTDGGAYRGIADEEITINPGFNQEASEWGNWAYSDDADNETKAWKLLGNQSEHDLDMSESLTIAQGDCSDDTEPSTDPTADFSVSDDTVANDETVTFDANNSSDDGEIVSYDWDFGDGNTATGETTEHSYDGPGDYKVTLKVTDDDDNSDTATKTVTVTDSDGEPPAGNAPTAKLSLTKQTADFDQKVGFDASASTDDGDIAEYQWDFDGDGDVDRTTPDDATGENNPAHTVWHEVYKLYDEPGTYTASVTVVDDDGHSDTANAEITIKEDATPPSATLHVPSEVTVGEEFTVKATDFTEDDLQHICWKIDGHDKPDGAMATHTFEEPGEYDVTLRIVDQAGNANLLERTITVTAADDGSDGSNGDGSSGDDSNDPPESGLDDDPNEGNTGGGVPAADPPEDDSNDESNDGDQTPKKAALDDAEGTYGEIVLQSDATDATVEVTESVPDDARQATAALDGFEALSYVTVSGAEDFDATFTVSKDRLESAEASPEDVTLFQFEDGSWSAVATEQLNETDDAFQFGANATNGTYAVGVGAPSTAVEDLRVANYRVAPGDDVTVTVTVENDGYASGTQEVALAVDGETVATKRVSVEADSTAEVEFTQSFDAPGVYAVSAGDENAELVVEGIETTATETTTELDTTTATETSGTNEGPGVPGFGVGAALVALAAAALLARRQA